MNFYELLKQIEPDDIYTFGYAMTLLEENNVNLNIEYKKWQESTEKNRFKAYNLYEFSVDDHCGGLYLYTWDDKQFAYMETRHEDQLDFFITNNELLNEFIALMLSMVSKAESKNRDYKELTYFPLIQIFDSAYNVMGKNLLLVNDDESFSLIESYWQDKTQIENDRINGISYENLYYYKYFEVLVNGVQQRVHYRSIVSVIGDSEKLAKHIAENMKFSDKEFNKLMKTNNIICINTEVD